jgi:casein kinase II subunit alpha
MPREPQQVAPIVKKYPRSSRSSRAKRVVARAHASVNLTKPKSYYDDELPQPSLQGTPLDCFLVSRQLGKGKYGEVFEAVDKRTNKKCVVKLMRPVKVSSS